MLENSASLVEKRKQNLKFDASRRTRFVDRKSALGRSRQIVRENWKGPNNFTPFQRARTVKSTYVPVMRAISRLGGGAGACACSTCKLRHLKKIAHMP